MKLRYLIFFIFSLWLLYQTNLDSQLLPSPVVTDLQDNVVKISETISSIKTQIERLKEDYKNLLLKREEELLLKRFERGKELFNRKDSYNAVTLLFYPLIQNYPSFKNFPEYEEAEYYLAKSFLYEKRTKEGKEYLENIYKRGSQGKYFADALQDLMTLAIKEGNIKLFDQYYKDYIKVTPNEAFQREIYYLLGKRYYFEGGDGIKKSLEFFKQIPQTSPQYLKALYFIGIISLQDGNYSNSIEQFENLLNLFPEKKGDLFELVLLNLGRLYYEKGDYNKSIEYYKKIDKDSFYYPQALFEIIYPYLELSFEIGDTLKNEDRNEEDSQTNVSSLKNEIEDIKNSVDNCVKYLLNIEPNGKFIPEAEIMLGEIYLNIKEYKLSNDWFVSLSEKYKDYLYKINTILETLGESNQDYYELISGGKLTKDKLSINLPEPVNKWILEDEKAKKGLELVKSIEDQKKLLEESDTLLNSIEDAINEWKKKEYFPVFAQVYKKAREIEIALDEQEKKLLLLQNMIGGQSYNSQDTIKLLERLTSEKENLEILRKNLDQFYTQLEKDKINYLEKIVKEYEAERAPMKEAEKRLSEVEKLAKGNAGVLIKEALISIGKDITQIISKIDIEVADITWRNLNNFSNEIIKLTEKKDKEISTLQEKLKK